MNKIRVKRIVQNADSVVQDDRELEKKQPDMPEDPRQGQESGEVAQGEPGKETERSRHSGSNQAEPGGQKEE